MKTINLSLFILLLSLLPYLQHHVRVTTDVDIPEPTVGVFVAPYRPAIAESLVEQVGDLTARMKREIVPVRYGSLDDVLEDLSLHGSEVVRLQRITAYNPVPWQTDASPDISSCGPNLDNQIALSQDLFLYNGVKHLCGQEVVLVSTDPRTGEVVDVLETVVWDTMNERYTLTADVFMNTTDESGAFAWGSRRGYLIIPQRN